MKITRKLNGYEVEFELSEEELEQAYREKERDYRLEDVKGHVLSMYQDDIFGMDAVRIIEDSKLMETILDRFFSCCDCNIPENDMMEAVIQSVLRGYVNSNCGGV